MNQSTLATQIATLTHVVDRLEQAHESLRGEQHLASLVGYLNDEVTVLHAVIDGLNTTYAELDDAAKDAAFESERH